MAYLTFPLSYGQDTQRLNGASKHSAAGFSPDHVGQLTENIPPNVNDALSQLRGIRKHWYNSPRQVSPSMEYPRGIKGRIYTLPPNCHALYLKGTRQ